MAFVPILPTRTLSTNVQFAHSIKRARVTRFGKQSIDDERSEVSSKRPSQQRVRRLVTGRVTVDPGSVSLLKTMERPPRVAVTRERGKNQALMEAVEQLYEFIEVIELPSVATFPLPEAMDLPRILSGAKYDADDQFADATKGTEDSAQNGFDWIAVTSPEAAAFIINAWREARCPALPKLAVVGRATAAAFDTVGVDVSFVPSKATGRTLCAELPPRDGGTGRVLYATSLKASGDIEQGLREKGYDVMRLNVYTTETAVFDNTMKTLGSKSDIVTFGSPSAVRGWIENIGLNEHMIVACIGETSAKAARKAGFTRVHFPQQPGLDGWLVAISEAMAVFNANKASGSVGGGRVNVEVMTDKDGNIYKA